MTLVPLHPFVQTRNIDSKHFLGELPSFVSDILQKILSFPGLGRDQNKEMDQLTVCTRHLFLTVLDVFIKLFLHE